MAKKKDIAFIVTRSDHKTSRVHFYEGSAHIPAEDVDMVHRDSRSGRYVTKSYVSGRDSETGQFTTVKEARRHSKDHVVEHIPASSPVYFRRAGKRKR